MQRWSDTAEICRIGAVSQFLIIAPINKYLLFQKMLFPFNLHFRNIQHFRGMFYFFFFTINNPFLCVSVFSGNIPLMPRVIKLKSEIGLPSINIRTSKTNVWYDSFRMVFHSQANILGDFNCLCGHVIVDTVHH